MWPFLWKSAQICGWNLTKKAHGTLWISGLTSRGRATCALQKQDGLKDGFTQLSGGADHLTDGPLVSMATEEAQAKPAWAHRKKVYFPAGISRNGASSVAMLQVL